MRLLVTLALDAPDDADPQGIKEKAAMDFEKYGGVRVVKVERVEQYQQMTMEGDRHAKNQPEEDHEGTNAQHVGNGVAGQCRGQRGDRRAK